MHLKNAQDFWAGALFIGAGVAAAWEALGHGVGSLREPGPGALPLGLAVLLALLGAVLWFKSLTIEAEGGAVSVASGGRWPWRAVLALAVATLAGPAVVHAAGAVLGLPLVGAVAATGWRGLALRRALVAGAAGGMLAAGAGAALYAAWLGQPLPWWPAGWGG